MILEIRCVLIEFLDQMPNINQIQKHIMQITKLIDVLDILGA